MRQKNLYSGVARLLPALAPLVALLLFPCKAAGWAEETHARIARLALTELLPGRHDIAAFEDDIVDGASTAEQTQDRWASTLTSQADIEAEIRLLTSISQNESKTSHYFAYRMGALGRAVADTALPLATNTEYSALLKEFETDIEGRIGSYKVRDISCIFIKYPSTYLARISSKSRVLEGGVRDAYLSGDGYESVEKHVVKPSLHRAVEATTCIWFTILKGDSPPSSVSAVARQNYYIDQIRLSSTRQHLDDVYSGLETLHSEGRRIPLTPSIVGKDFLDLPCNPQTSRIYELAMLVDPRSAVMAEKRRACDEYLLMNPVIEKKKTRTRRKIPGSLHGRGGKAPDIYVYEHESGLLLLTSHVKEVGPDYVLHNFKPVKKTMRRKVVRHFAPDSPTDSPIDEYDLESIINSHAEDYGIDPALIKAIIRAESDFDPHAVSGAGARGLMQLMPSTALEMQVDDIFNPIQNVGGGVQYYARMLELFNNDTSLALAAYNAGPGNVLKYGGIPPFKETQRYVPKVLKFYDTYKVDDSPVRLKVVLNEKPAADYLPAVAVTREIEETVSPPSGQARPEPVVDSVIVYLKDGSNMRGNAYERTPYGIKLIFDGGWIVIREELITEII